MRDGVRVVCAMVVVMGLAVSVWAREGEKLLFGFEREEVERAVQGKGDSESLFKVLDSGDFLFFRVKPGYTERELFAIRPMRCVREKASEGKYSCRVTETLGERFISRPYFRMPRFGALSLHSGTPQANLRLAELFNTSGWFDWVFVRDWSDYELLRLDVFLETPQAEKLLLEVEDDLVEPPVSLSYEAPMPGTWVTLEMDLTQAVKERGLNLAKMNNIWVRLEFKGAEKQARQMHELWEKGEKEKLEKRRFVAYVDNIRLCKKRTPPAHAIFKGTRSTYTMKLPRSYGVEEQHLKLEIPQQYEYPTLIPADMKMPKPAKMKPEPGPLELSPPSVIPIRDMIVRGCLIDEPGNSLIYNNVRLTCTAAFDPQHMVVGFWIWNRVGSLRPSPKAERPLGKHAGAAVRTLDGGKTWKGLDGTDWPTVLGGNISKFPPRPLDLGADVMGMYPFGCGANIGAHLGYPADRVFFVRSVFTGNNWWKSPKYFVSGESRHCHYVGLGDVVGTPSGRVWLVWASYDRNSYVTHTYSTFVYYSDDGGVTWYSWRGPGLVGTIPSLGRRHVRLVPYRGQVAAFGGGHWTWFDGKKWAEPEETGAQCWYAVSCGEEIYLSDKSGPVRWYDGKAWRDFSVPRRTGKGGMIGVCGWKMPVFVEADANGKKLLCWRKKEGGEWQGPEDLVSEETPVVQIAIQRYAPKNFLPVAYMCGRETPSGQRSGMPADWPYVQPYAYTLHEPWVKVLKVPAGE